LLTIVLDWVYVSTTDHIRFIR